MHKHVFNTHLRSGVPTKVTPMKIALDQLKNLVKVSIRWCPTDQRRLVDANFRKLANTGFFNLYPKTKGQAAFHLGPKYFESKNQTTIDFRPVNSAVKPEQWSMPRLKAKLANSIACESVAFLNFCSLHCQCPLKPSTFQAWGTITPQETYVSARVLHGLKNASAFFESTTALIFHNETCHQSVAWWIFCLHDHKSKVAPIFGQTFHDM